MINNKLNTFLVFLIVGVLISLKTLGIPTKLPDYKLIVSTIEDASGNAVQSNVFLKNISNGKITNGKYTNGTTVFGINKDENYKLIVESDGYYSEEKDLGSSSFENQDELEITVRLTSRPFAKINLKLADTKFIGEAKLDLIFNNKLSKSVLLSSKNPQSDLIVYESGEYFISGTAMGYKKLSNSLEIIVANPAVNIQKFINFEIQETSGEWNLINKVTDKIIKENGSFDLIDIQTSRVVKKGLIKEGVLRIDFPDTKTYKLKVDQKGYSVYFDNISILNPGRSLYLVEQSNVLILLKDYQSKENLQGNIQITGPNQKVVLIKSNTIFNPDVVGKYTLKTISEGYSEKNGSLIIETLKGGNIDFVLELERKIDDYQIIPLDADTKTPLKTFRVKVYDENGKVVSLVTNSSDQKLNIQVGKKYFYEITADGYNDFTSNLGNEKLIEVPLKKKLDNINYFNVVDISTKESIQNVKFRITNEKNELISVKRNPETKTFEADLKPESQYNIEATAENYQTYHSPINKDNNKNHTVSLSPISLESFTFIAYDELTKKPVQTEFLVTLNGNKVELNSTNDPYKKQVMLNKLLKYEIEASSKDYKTIKKDVSILGLDNDKLFKIYFNKTKYRVRFVINNDLENNDFETLKFDVTSNSGKKISFTSNKETKEFEGEVSITETLNVNVKSAKFENFQAKYDLNSLISSDFIKEILLVEKKSSTKIEEPVKPIVKEEIKAAPIVKETKTVIKPSLPGFSKDVNTFPISSQEVLSTFAENQLGKRYILGKVEFLQSSPTFTESSKEQLNNLAAMLLKFPSYKLQLTGYTDNVGNSKINLYLSEFRAKSISNYLFNKGVSANRISTTGKGNDEAIAPNDTEDNKAKNRRVEMVIIEI